MKLKTPLLTIASALLLTAASAHGQTPTADVAENEVKAASTQPVSTSVLTEVTFDERLIGAAVYTVEGTAFGIVESIYMEEDSEAKAIVLITEDVDAPGRRVALAQNQMTTNADGQIQLTISAEELRELPAFEADAQQ